MEAAVLEALAQMSENQLLAFGEEQEQAARRADCNKILLAHQWAIAHPADRLDPAAAKRPGRERAKLLGAEGTPSVMEFAPATLGGRLKISTWSAARLMGDAIDIAHRLPGIHAIVVAGDADARYARYVAQQTRHLTREEAAVVDEAVAGAVDGSVSWARFEQVVAGAVANAAPEVARRREVEARRRPRFSRLRGKDHEAYGMATLLIRGDVAEITQLEDAARTRADELEPRSESESTEERRVRALLELATGKSSGPNVTNVMPKAQLHVHAYTDAEGNVAPIARVEGHGPVTLAWVRAILGPRCSFTVRPVLDIEGLAPVDAYEIPADHRRAVHLITPADVFPYANCLSRAKEIDHTEPWRPPNQGGGFEARKLAPQPPASRIGNYGPMTKHHHRIKTHSPWEVRQPFPGIYLWRDPHGAHYLVDQTGTHRLASQRPTAA